LKSRKIAIGLTAVALAAVFLTVVVSGALTSSKTISSTGVIAAANLGIYIDSGCTQALTSLSWGNISPGGSVTRAVYVKNVGNTQVTLSMVKSNWNPVSANGPITLVWNREGTVLAVGQVTNASLTLSTSLSISGISSFSLDVIISGTG
jgi:hypothetical protein